MVRSRKILFLAVLALLATIGSVAFGQEAATIDTAYLRTLSARVTSADERLFENRIIAGRGSICGNLDGGYAVRFSVNNRRYHIQYNCMREGLIMEFDGITYIDLEADGKLDVVHEGTLAALGTPLFGDFTYENREGILMEYKRRLEDRELYEQKAKRAITDLNDLTLSMLTNDSI